MIHQSLIYGDKFGNAAMRPNQVIAMNGGRDGRIVAARHHQVKERHLGGCVLHGDAVRPKLAVGRPRVEILLAGVRQVPEQDLLGVGEWAPETRAHDFEVSLDDPVGGPHLCRRRLDRGHDELASFRILKSVSRGHARRAKAG